MSTEMIFVYLWVLPLVTVPSTYLAASGKLKRNGMVGLRIPSTMASDAAWRAGHRAAVPIMWLTVPVAIAASVGVATIHPGPQPTAVLLLGLAVLVMGVIAIVATFVAGKAARRVGRAE